MSKLHFAQIDRHFPDEPFAACSYWIKSSLSIYKLPVTCKSCQKTKAFKSDRDWKGQ